MPTVMLTGASGFIGSRLVPMLRRSGHTVVPASSGQPIAEGAAPFDLSSDASVLAAVRHIRPDIVIHLAAVAGVTGRDPLSYYAVNVVGTERLLRAIDTLGTRTRIIFASTAGVYGVQPPVALHEDMPPAPVHHYGLSKLVAERLMLLAGDRHDVTVFRPFNVIGPGQNASFLVPKLVSHFQQRLPVVRLGNLDVTRDYVDVNTTCSTIIAALTEPQTFGEVINICSGTGTSLRQVVHELCQLAGYEITIENTGDLVRKNEIWSLIGSPEKLNLLLPQRVRTSPVLDILRDMLHGKVFA